MTKTLDYVAPPQNAHHGLMCNCRYCGKMHQQDKSYLKRFHTRTSIHTFRYCSLDCLQQDYLKMLNESGR